MVKKQWVGIITSILGILLTIFGAGYFYSYNRSADTKVTGNDNRIQVNNGDIGGNMVNGDVITYQSSKEQFRSLKREETGKTMLETASGTYFYVNPVAIEYYSSLNGDVTGSAQELSDFYFEIQKSESDYILIGFINSTDFSKISLIQGATSTLTIYPNPYHDFTEPIGIPLLSTRPNIRYRKLDSDDQRRSIHVLDISMKGKVFTDVTSHTNTQVGQ
jgi:hypothetical protein